MQVLEEMPCYLFISKTILLYPNYLAQSIVNHHVRSSQEANLSRVGDLIEDLNEEFRDRSVPFGVIERKSHHRAIEQNDRNVAHEETRSGALNKSERHLYNKSTGNHDVRRVFRYRI